MTIDTIAKRVGQLPIKARQYQGIVCSFWGENCAAFSDSVNNVFFGDCTDNESVFFHELSHNLDHHVVGGSLNKPYSSTQDWVDTVLKGTCLPDRYAKADWHETYAQVGVLAAYHATVHSIFDTSPDKNIDCLKDSVIKVISQLDSVWRKKPGDQCESHWPMG